MNRLPLTVILINDQIAPIRKPNPTARAPALSPRKPHIKAASLISPAPIIRHRNNKKNTMVTIKSLRRNRRPAKGFPDPAISSKKPMITPQSTKPLGMRCSWASKNAPVPKINSKTTYETIESPLFS